MVSNSSSLIFSSPALVRSPRFPLMFVSMSSRGTAAYRSSSSSWPLSIAFTPPTASPRSRASAVARRTWRSQFKSMAVSLGISLHRPSSTGCRAKSTWISPSPKSNKIWLSPPRYNQTLSFR